MDFILQLQSPEGNFPCAMDELGELHISLLIEPDLVLISHMRLIPLIRAGPQKRPPSEELVHWCHGAPGTVYLLARAYLTWRDGSCLAIIFDDHYLCLVKKTL